MTDFCCRQDDQTDLLDNVPKSQQKLHTVKLMITVYEALMAYRIDGWSTESVHVSQSINSLFKSYNELVKFCTVRKASTLFFNSWNRIYISNHSKYRILFQRVSKPKKGDGKAKKDKDANDTTLNKRAGRPVGVKLPNTIMNLETVHKILCLLYEYVCDISIVEMQLEYSFFFNRLFAKISIQFAKNRQSLLSVFREKNSSWKIAWNIRTIRNVTEKIFSEGITRRILIAFQRHGRE